MTLTHRSWLSKMAARLMLAGLLFGVAGGLPLPAGDGLYGDLAKLCSAAGHERAPTPGEPDHCLFCLPLTGAAGIPPDCGAICGPSVVTIHVAVPDGIALVSPVDRRNSLPRGPPLI